MDRSATKRAGTWRPGGPCRRAGRWRGALRPDAAARWGTPDHGAAPPLRARRRVRRGAPSRGWSSMREKEGEDDGDAGSAGGGQVGATVVADGPERGLDLDVRTDGRELAARRADRGALSGCHDLPGGAVRRQRPVPVPPARSEHLQARGLRGAERRLRRGQQAESSPCPGGVCIAGGCLLDDAAGSAARDAGHGPLWLLLGLFLARLPISWRPSRAGVDRRP